MDLGRQLRYFLVVAEELHFGRAAERIGIAQPPLSQAIQRLERELGVELFDRSRRRVTLTIAGALLVNEARELLAREERLRTVMRKAAAGDVGTLRCGVPPETPATVLRTLLEQLAVRTPGLSVDLQELTTGEQVRLLTSGQLDVGLVHHPVTASDLQYGPAVDVPLGVVLPRVSPLARMAEIRLADLAGHDLVLFPRATAPGWYDQVLATCRHAGFTPTSIRHARNPEFMLGLVLAGHGVAFEQEAIARREPRVAWRPVADGALRRRISAAWLRDAADPAAPRFAAVAAEVLGAEVAPPVELATPGAEGPWSVVYAPPRQSAPPSRG